MNSRRTNPSLLNSPYLDSWIKIDHENRVHIRSGKVDIGQRISTALAILVGEELEVNPEQIVIDPPDTNYPDEGMTSGSNSMMQSGNALRSAAATARRHLLVKGGEKLKANASELLMDNGLISIPGTNHSITYSEALDNEPFGVPIDQDVPHKTPGQYRWIGSEYEPRGLRQMVTGSMRYIHDMVEPDMLHVRCVRPPNYFARIKSLDNDIIENLQNEGFRVVKDGSFLAIAGEDEYLVLKAAKRLARAAKWEGPAMDTKGIYSQLKTNPRESRLVVEGTPTVSPVPPLSVDNTDAVVTMSASYEKPYIMHGSIGPSAAMARIDPAGMLRIWTHSQGIQPLRSSIAEILNIESENITVQHVSGAGCYGHNGADDVAFDAALVALAIPGRTVLVKWTREQEHSWEPYGSAMSMELCGSLDVNGRVLDWSHETFSDTHLGRPRPTLGSGGGSSLLGAQHREFSFPPARPNPSMTNHAGLHRNIEPYYNFRKVRAVKNLVHDLPLRTSALRCLGGYANIFALESFMDELAAKICVDPVDFRLRHLDDNRAHEVINTAARNIDWLRDRPEGVGRGIAFSRYCNSKTYTAIAVELTINEGSEIFVNKAVVVADAGEVVDAAGLKMQLEGGFLQALSWTLYEEVTFDADGITSCDWDSYPIMRFAQAPKVDVIILDRPGEEPLGAGEASSEPVAAAIANALFNATGVRARRLPLSPDNLRESALNDVH